MAFVHAQQYAIVVAQAVHHIELRNRAIHGKHAIRKHQGVAHTRLGGLLQAALQIGHVVVQVAPALGFAQSYAVDDGGVVQLVADDCVFLVQKWLK
jgi:hypothetical protein